MEVKEVKVWCACWLLFLLLDVAALVKADGL